MREKSEHTEGRLRARPFEGDRTALYGPPPPVPERAGFLLRVPATYRPGRAAPLAMMLHGATGRAEDALALPEGLAERTGLILLAPNSRGYTLDVLLRG